VQSFKTIYRKKMEKFRFNFGIFCEMWCVTRPPPQLWNSDKNQVKLQLKFWYFQIKFALYSNPVSEMITIFVNYTVNLHPICLRICFRKRQNCSPTVWDGAVWGLAVQNLKFCQNLAIKMTWDWHTSIN
jgi:hypothetical protein